MKAANTQSSISSGSEKYRLPLCSRMTSALLCLFLAASVVVGTPLHPSDRGCNIPTEMSGCGHEGTKPTAPGMTSVPLCCVLDCQEPAPTGTVFTPRTPSLNIAFLQNTASVQPRQPTILPAPKWLQSSFFKPPETYLRNLALLI